MSGIDLRRYDSEWEEVKLINGYATLLAYTLFAIRGIGFLVVTWTTVVLLGGFVTMIDKKDFWSLTVITLVQMLCINDSFNQRMASALDLVSSMRTVKHLLTRNWQLANNARGDHQKLPVLKRIAAAASLVCVMAGWALALVHGVVLSFCLNSLSFLMLFGLAITIWISVRGLMEHDHYSNKGEGRTNMDPAHNVLYTMCVAQSAFFLYRTVMVLSVRRVVKQVSQAYGFQDGDFAVSRYLVHIRRGCFKNPSSVRGRNLITYAVELMESKSPLSYLSGTLILDRLLTRQHLHKIESPNLVQRENKQQRQQQQLDLEHKIEVPLVKNEKKEENKGRKKKQQVGWKKLWDETKKEQWGLKKLWDKIKKRQQHRRTKEEIIMQQRRVIKRLIGSASYAHILEKLLHTLDSRRSHDRKMSEAAARIVEHVARGIRLEQFPQGIQCISSLLNTFEEYHQFRAEQSSSKTNEASTATMPPSSGINNACLSSSESDSESESELGSYWDSDIDVQLLPFSKIKKSKDNTDPFFAYKDRVLIGLGILWRLAGSRGNCKVISDTEHLVCKIMAPVSYDIVHRTHHSAWSTSVVEGSLRVMLRFVTAEGETGVNLRQQISSNGKATTTIERIVKCEECKGRELQMNAIQILTQLCMDETERRGDFIKMLVSIFVNGNTSDGSIRGTAGKALVLFLGSKNVATIFPRATDASEFASALVKIVSDDEINTCRRSAAEILEHLCIHYTGNDEYLGILKNAMTGVTPKVLREILLGFGSAGEDGKRGYARSSTDVERQVAVDGSAVLEVSNKEKKNTSSSRQNRHNKLHLALLSLCVTACEKLHLDINAISPGEGDQGDQGEGVAFRFAMKMVQLNRDLMTADSLTVMKLTTRLVIAAMKKHMVDGRSAIVKQAGLQSLMDLLSSVSEAMLDLESCMVLAAGTRTTTIPDSVETLDSIVKLASELHKEIRDQDSEILPASSS